MRFKLYFLKRMNRNGQIFCGISRHIQWQVLRLLSTNWKIIWQKPGIGIAAVSSVPNRDVRKGEGTDYPCSQGYRKGKSYSYGQ